MTRLLAIHVLAPARCVWRLPLPDPAETPGDVGRIPVERDGRIDWVGPEPALVVSTALVDPLLRGFVLFARLFPNATVSDPACRGGDRRAELHLIRRLQGDHGIHMGRHGAPGGGPPGARSAAVD